MYEITTMLPNGKRPTVLAYTKQEAASLVAGLSCDWSIAYYKSKQDCEWNNHRYRLFACGILIRWVGSLMTTKYGTRTAKQFSKLIDSLS